MTRSSSREPLVRHLRERLTRHGAPKRQLLIIVGLSGIVALLVSAAGLRLGLNSMMLRYPLAAICGYVTFLVLIRAWIVWQRGRWDADFEPEMLNVDILPDATIEGNTDSLFQGGRSGGAGASHQWSVSSGGSDASHGSSHVDVDLDELWPVALAAVCAVGGLLAIAYIVYLAPVLLAEVALDGAVVATLYRHMRKSDAGHWAATRCAARGCRRWCWSRP
jgi:hypothetical protein